jgi:glycosyltransferase involved in cell wall biosynthesis
VVEDGITGFSCRVRDSHDLAQKMEHVILMSPSQRWQMGLRGRQKMEREFDEQVVIDRYVNLIDQILQQTPGQPAIAEPAVVPSPPR